MSHTPEPTHAALCPPFRNAAWTRNARVPTGLFEDLVCELTLGSECVAGMGMSPDAIGVPVTAVQKGSFTAWTVPEHPAEDEDYVIVILVKLPSGQINYQRSDLTGNVVGTDGYEQSLSSVHDDKGFVATSDSARLEIWVPGAESMVRDRISVSSALLHEAQILELVFN